VKKIIAFTSFLFLLMVAVLPQQAAQAASTYTATVTINGVDYEIDSYENTIYMNIDDLVDQFGLNETDKVEKVSIKTPAGAQSIELAPGYVSALFSGAQFPVVNNEAGFVLSNILGDLDSQQDGVSIKTFREFLYPVNNSVIGQFVVNYNGSTEDLVLVLEASKELELPGTTPVNVSGLSLTTSAGEVKAKNIAGNHYYLNVAGIPAGSDFQSIKVNSDTATTVSVFSRTSGFYSDATDVQFVGKEALLDKKKIANWAAKYGVALPTLEFLPIDIVVGVLYESGITTLNGIVADQAGNESPFSVTFDTGWIFADGNWYYLKANGDKAIAWEKIDGNWYYFDKSGAMQTGWLKLGNKTYYLNPEEGSMATGWLKIDGKWYYFSPKLATEGEMQTGWLLDGKNWYFLKSNGQMAENEWILDNNKWYFLGKNGAWVPEVKVTNTWIKIDNKWYFVDKNGVTVKNSWLKDGSNWYYLGHDGAMVTGWLYTGGKWYFLEESGAMKTGWLLTDGKWYFLENSGVMKTGWLKTGGAWYFLENSGAMKTGWLSTGGKWYFFKDSGVMQTGWLLDGKNWYFLENSGAMKTGWLLTGGKWYFLYNNGIMAANAWVDGYYLGNDGAWVK
jgi:glucan-binding YG repeat protein